MQVARGFIDHTGTRATQSLGRLARRVEFLSSFYSKKRGYRSEKQGDWLVQIESGVSSGHGSFLKQLRGTLETAVDSFYFWEPSVFGPGPGSRCMTTDILFGPVFFFFNLYALGVPYEWRYCS